MKKGLVNIITPTHNYAARITYLLDSVLKQTYPHVEMFVIDNASEDNTHEVLQNYVHKFADRGYTLHYILEEDGGPSTALNNGLKLVNGEFLLWPDADDWYKSEKAIETFVNTLNKYGDEVGIVRCQFESIDADTMEVFARTSFSPCNVPMNLFDDALHFKHGFAYMPIHYALKTKFLDQFIKNREIYVHRMIGHNAAILWPYFANTKCITIDEVLCYYLVRRDSESHRIMNYEATMLKKTESLRSQEHTISAIDAFSDKEKKQLIYNRRIIFYNAYLDIDYQYAMTAEFRKHYRECLSQHIQVRKKHKKVWFWTYLLSIQSYQEIQKIFRDLVKIVKKRNKTIH